MVGRNGIVFSGCKSHRTTEHRGRKKKKSHERQRTKIHRAEQRKNRGSIQGGQRTNNTEKRTKKLRRREKAEERHRDEDQPHHRLCPFISELKVTEYKNQEQRRRKLSPADESAETRTGMNHRLHSLQQPASRTRGSRTKNHKRKGTTPRMW